ncbi:MAG: SirB1 family protein [Gemmatimonadota bacterium]
MKPVFSPRRLLATEVMRPEPELNLARAALLIAQEEYPQLAVDLYLARLDQMAEEVKDRLAAETAPLVVFQELCRTLFERRGFRGNRESYYDPRNSFLNDVLDRGLGIPLTLGVVLLETGWRLNLPLEGVNFPGHFLVRFSGSEIFLLVDPFEGGTTFFQDEAQELLDRVYGGTVRLQHHFLQAATKSDILVRMLMNLKSIYVNVQDHPRALAAVERILMIRPLARSELRVRGLLLVRLGRHAEAVEQLNAYLDLEPTAPDAETIRKLVSALRSGETPDLDLGGLESS